MISKQEYTITPAFTPWAYFGQTGYPNTFIPFRNDIIRLRETGQWAEALCRLKGINRYQWPSRIDAFDTIEEMWAEEGNYCAQEIIEHWIALTSL